MVRGIVGYGQGIVCDTMGYSQRCYGVLSAMLQGQVWGIVSDAATKLSNYSDNGSDQNLAFPPGSGA